MLFGKDMSGQQAVTPFFEGAIYQYDQKTEEANNLLGSKSLNEYVAHENSITVQELINSPNMAYMINSAKENLILKMIDIFKANGFTDEEAWACVTADQF